MASTAMSSLPMQRFSASPLVPLSCFWTHRQLILTLSRREIASRYQGSLLGILWAAFNPVFMLAVYTFVFSVVFKARWVGGSDSRLEFALLLFAGLIAFMFFAECVNRAPTLVLNHSNYVKKVVFPLEILPWVVVLGGLFHATISWAVWLVAHLVFIGLPPPSIVLLPLILLPLVLLTLGVSWLLAATGVYLRDLAQVVPILTTTLMFLSPIFYPMESVPEDFHPLFLLNPLVPVIEQVRAVAFWGQPIAWGEYATHLGISALIAWAGLWWFQQTRRGFADVL